MSRFSGPGHEVVDEIGKAYPPEMLSRPAGPRAWVRWLKREQAYVRNAATPEARRRATREHEQNGRILRQGRWVTP
ncbi:hypothetical protein [Tenggerimyces flavus]|uniref:Uncharacterized protein n=1 Tax=Tenggerimyces flavus TaxID=1708749 RepID=A0ABV7YB63_9ACTN|nr:hypothetical protein [Tenggerimyces flavus]MBM7788895.1 hypothetical protein [Tenggerimyces flavus]